jgi:hypothetical protein
MLPTVTVERLFDAGKRGHLTIRPPTDRRVALLVDRRLQLGLREIRHTVVDGGYLVVGVPLDTVLAALLRHLKTVQVVLEFRVSDRCTAACQNGNPENYWTCVCSCRGRHHGGMNAGPPWVQAPGSEVLVAEDDDRGDRCGMTEIETAVGSRPPPSQPAPSSVPGTARPESQPPARKSSHDETPD